MVTATQCTECNTVRYWAVTPVSSWAVSSWAVSKDLSANCKLWMWNLNQIITQFGWMLKRGRAEPSRSLRPNIRPMFGVNRWNRTSVHLYWMQVNLAHPSFWSDGNADKGPSLPQQPLMSRTVRCSLRSCGFTRWKIQTPTLHSVPQTTWSLICYHNIS